MIKFIIKWLQKLKHKHQLPGEQNQKYLAQMFTQRQKVQTQNRQRITEKLIGDKESNSLPQTYEELFDSIDEDLLSLMAYTNWNKFVGFCASVNLQIHLTEEQSKKRL